MTAAARDLVHVGYLFTKQLLGNHLRYEELTDQATVYPR